MKPWKVQKLFEDLVWDLRSRNLLLPAIALVIGIVAVPVLLARSSSSDVPAVSGAGVAVSSASASPEGQSAVVAYDPGVRNFKQRLRGLASKDPFRQQFPAVTEAAGSASGSASTSSGSTSSSTSVPSTGGGVVDTGSSGGGSDGGSHRGGKRKTVTRNVTYQTSVLVGESGGVMNMINGVAQFAFLPAADRPVLVYLGTSEGGSQAIFMVSREVTSVGGTGTCFPAADQCQLLGLNAGAAAELIYGPDGKTYSVQVTRIKRVAR